MSTLRIETPRVFLPLLQPARFKGAWGGRGSGKSHFFAEMLIEECIVRPTRAVCLREVQKSIRDSVKRLLEDKIAKMGVTHLFEVLETEIRGKNGSLIIFSGLLNHTSDSIKSLENFRIAWVEEAHSVSQRSLDILRPTIRAEDSELWFSWNPETEDCAVEKLLRGKNKVSDSIVVEANWRDNPFFPDVLKLEMAEDKKDPDKYAHVWEGQYKRSLEGAVYANEIRHLYESNRIMRVLPIPGELVDTFWDLGHRDNTSIWFGQLRMGEYRLPRFYQNRGQKLEHYADYVKSTGYPIGTIWLPHDADQERLVGKSIAQSMRDLFPGVRVRVLPRMSKKSIGIEAARRIFPNCYFDEEHTKEGIKCLSRFRYDVDPDTGGYSQNPLHDEYSDGADAFAQLALSLRENRAHAIDLTLPEGVMQL